MKPTHTPIRNVRVTDDLWQLAREIAETNGETITDVIRRELENYVRRHEDFHPPGERSSR